MKKIIAIFMSIYLMSMMALPVLALTIETPVPSELIPSETTIIGSSKDENFEYYSVLDMDDQTAQAIQKDLSTGEYVYGPKVSFAQDELEPPHGSSPSYAPNYSTTHQDTFFNYEYDIYTSKNPIEWNLQRPDFIELSQYYFMVYENNSNLSYLEAYQNDVDALNDQEWMTLGYAGVTLFETIEALIASQAAISSYGVLTGEAAVSIVEAVMAVGDLADAIISLVDCINDCSVSYRDVLNNTDNIHYR